MKKRITKNLLLALLCLFSGLGYGQMYDVVWENLSKATFNSPTLSRQLGITGTGKATSENMLFGNNPSNPLTRSNGYMTYTPGLLQQNQSKKIGFSVTASSNTEITNAIDYGFDFLVNGKVRAFTGDSVSASVSFLSSELKIERKDDVMQFFVGASKLLEVRIDPTETLMLRAELRSVNSSFTGVKVSFSSKRFVVDPIINNTANTMQMQISGGLSPFVYYWEDGELLNYPDAFVEEKVFSKGLHHLKIEDADDREFERYFLSGNDITWTSFVNTQQNGKTLSKTTSTGWGSALSTATIGNVDYFWVQYVADVQQVSKAFGLAYTGTTFSQYSNLQAGFMMLPENQLQVIYQGNVMLTTEYTNRDALLISRDAKGLHWLINGKEIFARTPNFTSDLKVGGLLRDNASMTGVSFFNINHKPLLSSWSAPNLNGSITANITSLTNGNSPYHYYISENPIPPLHDIYLFTRDSIFTDTVGGGLDSLQFFEGSHLPTATTHVFEALESGEYYISVFDKTGLLILGNKINLAAPLEIYNASNMSLNTDLLTATQNSATADLNYYIDEGLPESRIGFTILNASERYWLGLSDFNATERDIQYGFFVNSNTVRFYVNGTFENTAYTVKNNNILSLEKAGSTLQYKINGVVMRQTTLTGSYSLKAQLEMAKDGTSVKVEPKKPLTKKYTFFNQRVNASCENPENMLAFNIKLKGSSSYLCSIHNTVTGTYIRTLSDPAFGSEEPVLYENVPLGVYHITGSFTTAGNQTHYINETMVIGIEAKFDPATNYVHSPTNYSLFMNTTSPATALSVNTVKADQTEWFVFQPFFPNNNTQSSFISLTSSFNMNSPYQNNEPYIEFYPDPGQVFYTKVKWYVFNESTNSYTAYGPVTIPASFPVLCSASNVGDQKVFKFKSLSGNLSFMEISLPINEYQIKTRNLNINSGFRDILCSFDCYNATDIYGVLKYELDGYYHIMKKGKIQFEYDNEYKATDLKFNIYTRLNTQAKNYLDFPAVPVEFGKNYITLDVSDNLHCLGKGFFYLETINEKNEKKYLRFYNDYDGCEEPEGPEDPGDPNQ